MATTLGSGEFRYEVQENWAKLPDGWELHDVAAVAVDHKDQVYIFNRGEHPMMVFDRNGNFCVPGAKACSIALTVCTSAQTNRCTARMTARYQSGNARSTAGCC